MLRSTHEVNRTARFELPNKCHSVFTTFLVHVPFQHPLKISERLSFLMFSGVTEKKDWLKMNQKYFTSIHPACNYTFKANNSNNRKRCEICLKLTKTPERCHFIGNFEHISHPIPLFLLLTLSR